MNELGISLLWCVVQVTLSSLVAGGVYLLLRRFRPAAAAPAVLSSLVMVVILSILAISPWPRWNFGGATTEIAEAPKADFPPSADKSGAVPIATAESSDAPKPIGPKSLSASKMQPSNAAFYVQAFIDEITKPQTVATDNVWGWPAIVAVVLLATMIGGMGWLALGVVAVRRQRLRGRRVLNVELLVLVESLRNELGCRRPIEVRECDDLATAATIGWRRPTLLLPSDWTLWTIAQRRAILAHEIAHARSHDFLALLCGQLGVMLHFYHPLVHWLMNRLRLEQELAADAAAAGVSGGQREYLTAIAELALRQQDRPLVWPARSFLPSRNTFLRRISMLRDSKLRFERLSPRARILTVGAIVFCGFLIAGLRGPSAPRQALADDAPKADVVAASPAVAESTDAPKTAEEKKQYPEAGAADPFGDPRPILGSRNNPYPAQTAPPSDAIGGFARQDSSEKIDLTYLPVTARTFIVFRPAAALAQAELAPWVKLAEENRNHLPKGHEFKEFRQITIILPQYSGTTYPKEVVIYQCIEPTEASTFLPHVSGGNRTRIEDQGDHKKMYLETVDGPEIIHEEVAVQYDERTIVTSSSRDNAVRYLQDKHGVLPSWLPAKEWESFSGDLFLVAGDMTDMRHSMKAVRSEDERSLPGIVMLTTTFSPIWENTSCGIAGLRIDGHRRNGPDIRIHAALQADDQGAAENIEKTGEAARVLALNAVDKLPMQVPPTLKDNLKSALNDLKLNREGLMVHAESEVDLREYQKLVLPAVVSARQAARGMQSQNNLKMLALAMLNYADAHKYFPPAILYGGPDKKTPYSWRVALLPYLDQKALYDQYHFDEPWDSPNNSKVMAQMPAVFRCPTEPEDSKNSSYYVVTGPGAIFDAEFVAKKYAESHPMPAPNDGSPVVPSLPPPNQGMRLADILDGTAHTLLLVEAKRDIPWTKPEDIAYDPEKPLPDLHGFYDGKFHIALADGTVRFLPKDLDKNILRLLIDKDDKQPVQLPPDVR